MKYTLLVTIESDAYDNINDVCTALQDGWEVNATDFSVFPVSEAEALDSKLAALNGKISAAKQEVDALETARDAVRREIRNECATCGGVGIVADPNAGLEAKIKDCPSCNRQGIKEP